MAVPGVTKGQTCQLVTFGSQDASEYDVLVAEDLVFDVETRAEGGDFMGDTVARRLRLEAVEKVYIQRVPDAVGGVKLEAARVLGIDRRTLYRKLEQPE